VFIAACWAPVPSALSNPAALSATPTFHVINFNHIQLQGVFPARCTHVYCANWTFTNCSAAPDGSPAVVLFNSLYIIYMTAKALALCPLTFLILTPPVLQGGHLWLMRHEH
jgi:hypothetical protein